MDNPADQILPPKKRKPTNVPLGTPFGKWTTLERGTSVRQRVRCECECGELRDIVLGQLLRGLSTYCHFDSRHPEVWHNNSKHLNAVNRTKTREYAAWQRIKRTFGIDRVFDGWWSSFASFRSDVGESPGRWYVLRRINSDGRFEPGNTEWVTKSESQRGGRTPVRPGSIYGHWTALGSADRAHDKVLCRCDCGVERPVGVQGLVSGRSTFCKRYRNHPDIIIASKVGGRTHGKTSSKEYNAWNAVKRRCADLSDSRYGGRGISMCVRWRDSFEAFFEDVGLAPSLWHSLDRINNDGNYEPGNVKWSTAIEQGRNQRKTVRLTLNGETKPLMVWAEQFGIPSSVIRARLTIGWSEERAITTPLRLDIRHKSRKT
jgi:hypothetical protein